MDRAVATTGLDTADRLGLSLADTATADAVTLCRARLTDRARSAATLSIAATIRA